MINKRLILPAILLTSCAPSSPSSQSTPDGGNPVPRCTATSSTAELRINEFMARNAVTLTNGEGISYPWIEIHNASSSDASMCGWTLRSEGVVDPSNEQSNQQVDASYVMADLVVPAGGHQLIWLLGDRQASIPEQASLSVSKLGGELSLRSPDDVEVDRVEYGLQAVDFAAARITDGSALWGLAWHPSPGAPNSDLGLDGEFQATAPGQVPPTEGLKDLMLGYDQMPEIAIRIDDVGIEALRGEPRIYVPGYLTVKGREYGPVGVRLKGQNSFQPIDDKPSFRINIDEFISSAKLFHLDDLTLNNMDNDFSMMHERLGYFIARQFGPASRANHAMISLNGEPYGVYTNVETVKRHMLEHWFEDADGSLFEATDVDFRPEFVDAYEVQDGPGERVLIAQLATALQNPSPDLAMAAASEVLDMAAFFQFWATCAVIGQFDSFPYSDPGDDYFAYADPTTNKLHFLPWGMDETFYSGSYDVLQVNSLLATTCLASPACKQEVVDVMWQTLELVEALDWAAERIRIIEQVSSYMMSDANKPYTNEEVLEFHTQLGYFIEGRRTHFEEMLPPISL